MSSVNMYRSLLFRKILTSNTLEVSRWRPCRNLSVYNKTVKPSKTKRALLIGISAGVGLGVGYSIYIQKDTSKIRSAVLNPGMGNKPTILPHLPDVPISEQVVYPTDGSGLKIVLFQYSTCPFCCKVRAFLDYHGLSYDIVEVNPVLRQQLKWSEYKKVPILLVKTDNGFLQLNDSSMIISALKSFLHEKNLGLQQVANFYPSIKYEDNDGNTKSEILNRYFLMYQGNIPAGATKESIAEERKWRKWADDRLVHALSPNVYRSTSEALESFNWFSQVGGWEQHFSNWERLLVIYVGAFAMWIIGKRLKRKHGLKDDVRESLYDDCNVWLRHVRQKQTQFHGGAEPDLADLAVYGVLSSIEGCTAFTDLLAHTKLEQWYSAMRDAVHQHKQPQ